MCFFVRPTPQIIMCRSPGLIFCNLHHFPKASVRGASGARRGPGGPNIVRKVRAGFILFFALRSAQLLGFGVRMPRAARRQRSSWSWSWLSSSASSSCSIPPFAGDDSRRRSLPTFWLSYWDDPGTCQVAGSPVTLAGRLASELCGAASKVHAYDMQAFFCPRNSRSRPRGRGYQWGCGLGCYEQHDDR